MSEKELVFIPHPVERTEYVTREVNITEKRAPTDESVALLKEFEEAARAKIEETFVLADNGFDCRIMVELQPMTYDWVVYATYTLNGKKIRSAARVGSHEIGRSDHERNRKLFERIKDEVAKDLAQEILAPAYRALLVKNQL